jgi:hypothetical protein
LRGRELISFGFEKLPCVLLDELIHFLGVGIS